MDTDLSDHSGLEDLWADHPNCTVPALPVVVQFNVLEHLPSHGLPRFESLTMDGLDDEAHARALASRDDRHWVYHRTGEPCRVCGTPIAMRELGGRKLYWCPTDQA